MQNPCCSIVLCIPLTRRSIYFLQKRRVTIGEHNIDMRKATPKSDRMSGGWGAGGMGFGGPGENHRYTKGGSMSRMGEYRFVSNCIVFISLFLTKTVPFSKIWYDNCQYRYHNFKNRYDNFWDRYYLCFQSHSCLITVPLTSCLTGLESALWQLTTDNFLLFAKQTNLNQSNRRSMVEWYFPQVFPDRT
jgi:hypothetical protein